MGKSTTLAQRTLESNGDNDSPIDRAIKNVQKLEDEPLIQLLIEYGIYKSKNEMLIEYHAGSGSREAEFGDKELWKEFIERSRADWIKMLQSIKNGKAANGEEARAILYGGRDAISRVRRNTLELRTGYSNRMSRMIPR